MKATSLLPSLASAACLAALAFVFCSCETESTTETYKNLQISPSYAEIGPGGSVTLTASGGRDYTWALGSSGAGGGLSNTKGATTVYHAPPDLTKSASQTIIVTCPNLVDSSSSGSSSSSDSSSSSSSSSSDASSSSTDTVVKSSSSASAQATIYIVAKEEKSSGSGNSGGTATSDITIYGDDNVKVKEKLKLTASGGNGSYKWSKSGGTLTKTTGSQTEFSADKAGTYTITVSSGTKTKEHTIKVEE